jgi:hypothetical protein
LENLDKRSAIHGAAVTLNFEGGTLSGTDGCNRYRGSYRVEGETITVNRNVAVTKMACAEPIMQQASEYMTALTQANTYRAVGFRSTLQDRDGQTLAINQTPPGKNPENATYLIEGEAVTLVNGMAETALAPGSASRLLTRYFGNAIAIDLNVDGLMDSAFLLWQSSGGSGTFYYVAAALNTPEGYRGTNAILLGDRIAPQRTMADPDNPGQVIVSYADRPAGEPMSSAPTQMVSRTFKLKYGLLVEVVRPSKRKPSI